MRTIRVVGTLIESRGKILILLRRDDRAQPNQWGLPAGFVLEGENDVEAALREVKEETGYDASPQEIDLVHEFDWYFEKVNVQFPTFRIQLENPCEVELDRSEHVEFRWVTPEECYALDNLIHGFKDLLETIYKL